MPPDTLVVVLEHSVDDIFFLACGVAMAGALVGIGIETAGKKIATAIARPEDI